MKKIKNILLNIRIFWYSLFKGLKNADNLLTTNQSHQSAIGIEIPNNEDAGVYKEKLQQKVTQEVEELRYSSYKIANESKKYKYIGNGEVKKKTNTELTEKHGLIDERDNLPIILIQDNNLICEDVLTTINEVNESKNKKITNDYTIKIKREILPRFLIEKYIKKIVLKESDTNYVIDLYCSKYPKQFNTRKDKPFISELEKIKNKEVKNSDILDFEEIKFTTSNAWGVDDWYSFILNDFELYDIIDFDGNYIIRLGCKSKLFMNNLLDNIYSKSAEKKYNNREKKKNVTANLVSYFDNNKEKDFFNDLKLENLKNVELSVDNKE